MGKCTKMLLVVMMLTILSIVSCNNVFAALTAEQKLASEGGGSGASPASGSGYSSQMKTLIGDADNKWKDTTGASSSVNSIVSTVITIVRIIGVAVALIMLLVVAMKYMSAAPGEKAEIKKSAIVYVVGAIVLFAVTGILGLINQFAGAFKAG